MATKEELQAEVDRLAMLMLKKELEATKVDDDGRLRQDWDRRRAAAEEIVRRAGPGVLPALKAMSRGGALDLPPPWPAVDIIAVGGGAGFIDADVRSYHPSRGILIAHVRMAVPAGQKPTQAQVSEAYQRGAWELKKRVEAVR